MVLKLQTGVNGISCDTFPIEIFLYSQKELQGVTKKKKSMDKSKQSRT